MVAVALVMQSTLSLAEFMPAANYVTGVNYVSEADAARLKGLSHTIKVINNFSDKSLATSLIDLGFFIAGPNYVVSYMVEIAIGMRHVSTSDSPEGSRAILLVGSLDQWRRAVIEGCKPGALLGVREGFNRIYHILCQVGLKSLFDGFSPSEQRDRTFLLRSK